MQGTCQIHDLRGNFVAHVGIRFLERDYAPAAVIVGIDWYNGLEGYSDPNAPSLALAFQVGKIQVRINPIKATVISVCVTYLTIFCS